MSSSFTLCISLAIAYLLCLLLLLILNIAIFNCMMEFKNTLSRFKKKEVKNGAQKCFWEEETFLVMVFRTFVIFFGKIKLSLGVYFICLIHFKMDIYHLYTQWNIKSLFITSFELMTYCVSSCIYLPKLIAYSLVTQQCPLSPAHTYPLYHLISLKRLLTFY